MSVPKNAAVEAIENQQSLELATKVEPTFNLPVLVNPEEASEIIAENMEGMGEFYFDKIKMPSGGGITFEIVDDEGNPDAVKELRGVLLDKFPFKVWYEKSYDEKGQDDDDKPDCFSDDNIHGSGFTDASGRVVIPEGQLCKDCKFGQWGSHRKGGDGKDCADKIRVHILMEGEAFPKYIDAPPTSLKNFKKYVKMLSNKAKSFYGVVTCMKLEKDKNDGGVDYSKVLFTKSADLTRDERLAVKDLIQTLLPSMHKITRDSIGEPVVMDGDDVIDAQGAIGEDEEPF